MASVTVVLRKDKETPHKVRYQESDPDVTKHVIGTLYVPKATLTGMGTPENIKVTIEAESNPA
jgi:hypothetical protein